MINQTKWIDSIPKTNEEVNKQEISQLDPNIWVNTIPKKNIFNSLGKYSLTITLFVCGLLIVSAVKNETRNLQKEIDGLQASINSLNSNLDQAILDNEVITSPENISKLAKEYLSDNFVSYKKSQISYLKSETYKNSNKISFLADLYRVIVDNILHRVDTVEVNGDFDGSEVTFKVDVSYDLNDLHIKWFYDGIQTLDYCIKRNCI